MSSISTDTRTQNTTDSRLISLVIRSGEITQVLDRGVTPSWFTHPDDAAVWRYIADFYNDYGKTPEAATLKAQFPDYRLLRTQEAMEPLVDILVDERRRANTMSLLQNVVTLVDQDHNAALALMARDVGNILDEGTNTIKNVDLMADPEARIAEYENYGTDGDGLLGIGTGFPTMDRATLGLQPEQLVTIIAKPKVGKSALSLIMAINAHKAGNRIFFQTFEMSYVEQQRRHDAFRAHINWTKLVANKLSDTERKHLNRTLRSMVDLPQFIVQDSSEGLTTSALSARVAKYDPDIIFVDGVYLMTDDISGEQGTPQALTNITRSLKRLAQRTHKPLVMTTQVLGWKAKGNRVGAEAIGYSSSFFQDSDVIFALERVEDQDDVRVLRVDQARNLAGVTAEINWDWSTSTFEEYAYGN